MNEFEAIRRLEHESWFQELCQWYQDGIVEGVDGATYKGRDVLDRRTNLSWVKSRMVHAHVEDTNPGWVLGILEDKFPKRQDPQPLQVPTLIAILENEGTR